MADDGGFQACQVRDGAFVRYVEIPGSDPPLVWVHGWQCSSTAELLPIAVQPPLAGRRSVLVDLLGHGYSDKPPDFGYALVDHAQTVVELIDRMALRECVLVGHSMGGEIAVRVAAARPEVVTTLVMLEGTLDAHGEEVLDGQSEAEFVDHGFAELVDSMRARAAADPSSIPAVHVGLTALLEPRAVYRSAVSMRDGHEPQSGALLAELSMPRWYLGGALSEPEPEFDHRLVDIGVRLLLVPDTGHAMGFQNPRGTAEAVAEILAGTA